MSKELDKLDNRLQFCGFTLSGAMRRELATTARSLGLTRSQFVREALNVRFAEFLMAEQKQQATMDRAE